MLKVGVASITSRERIWRPHWTPPPAVFMASGSIAGRRNPCIGETFWLVVLHQTLLIPYPGMWAADSNWLVILQMHPKTPSP